MTDEYKGRGPYKVERIPDALGVTRLMVGVDDKLRRRFKTLKEAQELVCELHQLKPNLELEILDGKNVVMERITTRTES